MKTLSRDEMKKVMGGIVPPEGCVAVCGGATFYAENCEDAGLYCSNSASPMESCRCRPGGY
jgi:hypothetical protein